MADREAEMPDQGHGIGGNFWNKEIYSWLLRHSRRGDKILVSDAKPDETDASSTSPTSNVAPTLTTEEIGQPPSPPAGWTEGYVIGNGIRIHYWRTGGDKPAMVMAHGSSDNGLRWTNRARELADDYDIILADVRGHGLLDPGSASDPADAQAEDR